ncbi:hypothetical protein [Nocardia macrotermitis]|uniref:Uncharacterized protein n=1 Tax=Nocardia macrotermitis TaxID=2585198 RepID=A0A7K0D9P2_9NOCA|nr:hypothetical protein [Nocardia macrotermitis]MQY22329.1 hypothetical protein [Nocardia macrotermitis]
MTDSAPESTPPAAPQWDVQTVPPEWEPPPGLIEAAAANAGGSVVDIDPAWVDDPSGYVPPGAVRGLFPVDEHGKLIREYHRNPAHTAPRDDFRNLYVDNEVGLLVLGENPEGTVREYLTNTLTSQVPGTGVEWIWVAEAPGHQVAGKPAEDDQIILTRLAVGIPFAVSVRAPEREREVLAGTFSIIWAGLDETEPRLRVWLDLWESLEWAVEQFPTRMYEV